MEATKKARKKNLFVVGPPRSGTTLLSKHLNEFPDVVSLSEIFFEPWQLLDAYEEARASITAKEEIKNSFNADGTFADNLGNYGTPGTSVITKPLTDNYILAHKGALFWLINIEFILRRVIPVLITVRDPVPTICSWCTEDALKRMTVAQMTQHNVVGGGPLMWNHFIATISWPQEARTAVERRAYLWNQLILTLVDVHSFWGPQGMTYLTSYERMRDNDQAFQELATWMGTPPPVTKPVVKTLNTVERYGEELVEQVTAAVKKFAPIRELLKYE